MLLTFVGSVLTRSIGMYAAGKNILILARVVAVTAALFAPVKPLLDAALLNALPDKMQYGRSRMFGQVGFGAGSAIAGPFIASMEWVMMLAHVVLAVPTAFLMMQQEVVGFEKKGSTAAGAVRSVTAGTNKITAPSQAASAIASAVDNSALDVTITESKSKLPSSPNASFRQTVGNTFSFIAATPHVLGFLVLVAFLGISSGVIENFCYAIIADVSSKGSVALSVSRLLSCLAGGPVFWYSGRIIQALGVPVVMLFSMVVYAVRFLWYSRITQGWHAIPAEMMRGASFALFWAAATFHVYERTPPEQSNTMVSPHSKTC
jgi:hypothetical protein